MAADRFLRAFCLLGNSELLSPNLFTNLADSVVVITQDKSNGD
jgi:hypothetical protein